MAKHHSHDQHLKPAKPRPGQGKPPASGTAVTVDQVQPGQVGLFAIERPNLSFIAEMGDNAPRIIGGYAKWDIINRTGRKGLTHFTGYDPLVVEIEVFVDAFTTGDYTAVEQTIAVIEGMAGRGSKRADGPPPRLHVSMAGAIKIDYQFFKASWVMTGVEWDEDGTITQNPPQPEGTKLVNRLRAPVTLTLTEYIDDTELRTSSAAAAKAKGGSARRTYIVRNHDTLMKIARDELGDAGRWRKIAELNNLRDPRHLKTGQRLRLP